MVLTEPERGVGFIRQFNIKLELISELDLRRDEDDGPPPLDLEGWLS